MIVEFSVQDTPAYSVEHLFDSSENEKLIFEFEALNGTQGLENYLKIQASADEKSLTARTYLIKDKTTEELAGYFSLRSGLITIQAYHEEFETIPTHQRHPNHISVAQSKIPS